MNIKHMFLWGGLLLFLPFLTPFSQSRAYETHPNDWEAVNATVPVGKGVKIEVRVKNLTPLPAAADITVTHIDLDMAPDKMEAMKAPLKPLPSPGPGILAFETDFIMAGRWELEISADVKGEPEPYSGSVIFTAVDKDTDKEKSDSTLPDSEKRKILYYRNPMGLPDTSPVPKKDTMGMDYIPVYEEDAAGPEGSIRLSPDKIQRAGVRTEPVERRVLAQSVRGTGMVVADEARVGDVTARFSGYVEKLYVAETGVSVRKGQPLMRVRIEDADLIARQNDLTKTLMSITQKMIITENAQRDLQYIYGFSPADIEEIRKSRRPIRFLTLRAPENGTVSEKPVVEGMRFNPGDILMRTTDYSKVWVIAQIPERDLGKIKLRQIATVTPRAYMDASVKGKITLIYPELDMATRTGRVRIELANSDGALKTGMYADISIDAASKAASVIAVPDSAVIDSGVRQVAFVAKDGGVFEPRNVKLGQRGNGYIEIKDGLSEGESIVVSGNFLIDAESNLQSALASFAAKTSEEKDTTAAHKGH